MEIEMKEDKQEDQELNNLELNIIFNSIFFYCIIYG